MLAERDQQRVLGFLREAEAFCGLEEFERGTVAALRRLIPCDACGYNAVDPGGGHVDWVLDPPEVGERADAAALARHADEHPLVMHHARTPEAPAARLSDFVGARRLHRTGLYAEFLRPIEVEFQLVVTVSVPGRTLVGVPFNRRAADFTDDERDLLDLLRPHLAALHRRAEAFSAVQQALSHLDGELGARHSGVIVLDRGGRPGFATSGARRALGAAFGDDGQMLPTAVDAWVRAVRARRETVEPVVPFVAPTADGTVRLTYVPAAGERAEAVVVDHRRTRGPAALGELGLTARESEVLALLAVGRSDRAIAGELTVSVRTVHTHLAHVYAKLGVHNRTAAVARAYEVWSR